MIEIRQAEVDLPWNGLLVPFGHTNGLLCRRCPTLYAPAVGPETESALDERTGDYATVGKKIHFLAATLWEITEHLSLDPVKDVARLVLR
jgi:hypothetical protein